MRRRRTPVQGLSRAPGGYPAALATPAERQKAAYEQKLEDIKEQVDDGSLTIRQMTDEEKHKYRRVSPVRPPRKSGGKR